MTITGASPPPPIPSQGNTELNSGATSASVGSTDDGSTSRNMLNPGNTNSNASIRSTAITEGMSFGIELVEGLAGELASAPGKFRDGITSFMTTEKGTNFLGKLGATAIDGAIKNQTPLLDHFNRSTVDERKELEMLGLTVGEDGAEGERNSLKSHFAKADFEKAGKRAKVQASETMTTSETSAAGEIAKPQALRDDSEDVGRATLAPGSSSLNP